MKKAFEKYFYIVLVLKFVKLNLCTEHPLNGREVFAQCFGVECPFGKKCAIVDSEPKCLCNSNCLKSALTGPVCSTNGHTYNHLCELKEAECHQGSMILVSQYGRCNETKSEEACYDAEDRTKAGRVCGVWKAFGGCETQKEIMMRQCKRTCKFCKGTEPTCFYSKFGCCFDSSVPAQGANQEGCTSVKDCKDGGHCSHLEDFCGAEKNREMMKKHCPYTCRYCKP